MSKGTAVIIGSTGLIGSALYHLVQKDKSFDTVRLIVRRPLPKPHGNTEVKLINFEDAESFKMALEDCNVVFCAVGTTQQKVAGSKEAYRRVDFNIPVLAAKFSKEAGVQHFSLVSAVGAQKSVSNFYLRLKGEVEERVQDSGLSSVAVFRPSLLLGNRSEKRTGERIAQIVMPVVAPLFFGPLSKYKPIQAATVAAAMLAKSKEQLAGFHVYEWEDMQHIKQHLHRVAQ